MKLYTVPASLIRSRRTLRVVLFQVGVRIALAEREQLAADLADAQAELDRARAVPNRAVRVRAARRLHRGFDVVASRGQPTRVTASAWPVRVPGTATVLSAIATGADHRRPVVA
ncbi:hypothetical protein ACPPVW_18515 [Leifsonia sp. McL0607]|uniref:hypothetical protein n=1 Tax=Leifsonia sp. McL0607 TaxID=3415672 RepID=UPI003CF73B88